MNKDGKIVWADLKFNDPDAPVSETIMYPIYDAIFGKGKLDQREFDERLGQAFATSLKEFFEPLTTETLLSEALVDKFLRNGTTEDGQYIDDYIVSESPDFEIYANNQIASWKHIAEKLYKVGAYKNLERYAKAKSGDKDIYGVGYDLSSEKLANFTGFRFNVIDDKRLLKSLHMALFKFNRERSNATTVMYTDIKKKETTLQDFVNNYTLANKMYYKQYVKTKNKLHSLNELMEFDNLREKEGKEKIYNLNQAKIDLVVNERIQSSVVEDDFKIFTPQIDYFKPIEPSTEKIDEFMQMHPDVNRSELKNILKQISNDFRKLPLLELKEDYNDDQLEVIERLGLAKGGFVKGPDVVPFTKEDPADRINPLTGLSYDEEAERKQFAEGGAIEFRNNQESDRLMKNIAKSFPSIENQQSFIQNISKTLGKNVKSLDNKSLALVTARILDTFYPAQDNRNNNMLKSFSFGDYSNQREKVLKYNETVAIKRINNYFEKQKNLQSSGWNPTKTAELLKGRDTYNVGGIVLRKVMQLKAAGKDVEYDPSAAQKTQIATTGGTYEKASKIMDDYNAYDSLDYGSGIQINQARQVLKADTYEPYPQLDKADKYGTPDFVEPEEITRKYNFITNFSVLNVLPKLDRDKAVKHIGSLLQDNGVAVITVRSKDDVLKALPNAKKQLSDSELITARGTYQKGFTRDELKKYLNETLGKDYEVMDLPNKYKMSGVGVLIKKSPRSKFSEGGKVSTNEQMDRLGFDNGGETPGPPKFEKRIARPDPEMFIKDPESGNPQTHRMGWGKIDGKFIAYPTIVEQDGKLVQYDNNTETMKLMKKSGNFKAFDTKEEAEAYADGSWKTKEFNKTYRKGLQEGGPPLSSDQKMYLTFYNMAREAGVAYPAAVAAQASLESGHGTSELATKYNNPLGIKVNRPSEIKQGQPSVQLKTQEFVEGKEGTYKEPFRTYNNLAESFVGYKEKVAAPRYDSIRQAKNEDEYLTAIANSGYATDPLYAEKTINIKNRYANLIPKD